MQQPGPLMLAAAITLAGAGLLLPLPQAARAQVPGNIAAPIGTVEAPALHLEASATGRVAYDTAHATLFVEREGPQAPEPTREVNRVLGALFAEAKALKGIQASTGNYVTHPMFDRGGKITGYRVRADLLIESRQFDQFADALGKLSAKAPISNVSYDLSPAARATEEERLLNGAAEAFRKKAQAAAVALGFRGYSLLELQVGSGGAPIPRTMRTMGMVAASVEIAPPPIAPESATITLTLSGRVRLER